MVFKLLSDICSLTWKKLQYADAEDTKPVSISLCCVMFVL